MIIPKEYYLNQDVCFLAKDLLGKVLVTNFNQQYCSGIIVETEAYRGPDDRASHSYNNRISPRNKTMYCEGGCCYVYICYGLHHLFNIVTAPENYAHAVLIRALEPLEGLDHMKDRRPKNTKLNVLTKGPGALSQAMGIAKDHDATLLWNHKSYLQIHDLNYKYSEAEIASSLRIGVESAGESAFWPWRYFVKSSPCVSAHKKIIVP